MSHSVARNVSSLAPLTPLTPLTRSAALCFTTLALLACSVHGLAHSLCSLLHGTVEIHEETRYWSSLETRPNSYKQNHSSRCQENDWAILGVENQNQKFSNVKKSIVTPHYMGLYSMMMQFQALSSRKLHLNGLSNLMDTHIAIKKTIIKRRNFHSHPKPNAF